MSNFTLATTFTGKPFVSGIWALLYVTLVPVSAAAMAFGVWRSIHDPSIITDTILFGLLLFNAVAFLPSSNAKDDRPFRIREAPLSLFLIGIRLATLASFAVLFAMKYLR